MKIYYFSGSKIPSQDAESVHVMKMAQALAKCGHDVTLYGRSIAQVSAEELYSSYDTDPCFSIRLSSSVIPPALSAIKTFRDGHPDLAFGHDVFALTRAAREGIPVVYEAHDFPRNRMSKMSLIKLLKSDKLKAIITVSDILKQQYLNNFNTLKPEQIFVAHDGADLIDYLDRPAKQLDHLKGRADAYNVGYAGSLHPGKGLALISRIARIRPEYDFHVLGGTQKQVQRLQTENKLKNIHFYGHRDHAEVPAFLKAFDVCIAPYQHRALIKTGRNTSRWISPMKLFEYMAAGKPILCSNLPIIQEIITNDYNGILLPASDEEEWAETIDELRDDPEICKALGKNAYESLKDNYTWDKRAAAVLAFAFREQSQIRFAKAS